MGFTAILLFILAAADAKVLKLTNNNFEQKTQASRGEYSGYWVVSFCNQSPRCQKLQGIMGDLSNELKRTSKGLVFATVDTGNPINANLLERFGVHDTPTLIFIEQAHFAKYSSRTFSKSKVKTFAQTHAHGETFRRVPKPKDIIEETIGPVLEAFAGFVFFWPVQFLMGLGLAEMPARILWFGVLYVSGKTFEETVYNKSERHLTIPLSYMIIITHIV
uniref:Thioredoxin domain-containing protein n=1 Tax=Lotharella globosa TaxID=91324 RepID=A0A7S3YWM5_9EUKA